ncbi:MAG: right-handed parallel beta-helix repeat-containing protein [Verrucomicrobia bacterium]|nr:right-handed parallel beta-helix repeat-containing protein [Verrucomicrobiota bacterium]
MKTRIVKSIGIFRSAVLASCWIVVLVPSSKADTNVSGTVSGTWSAAGSPYIVTGDLTVSGSLAIDAGVVVRFQSATSLTVPSTSLLQVAGTPDQRVLFTSDQFAPAPGNWDGLRIINSQENNSISHATVEYATDGISCVGGPGYFGQVTASNVTVRHCSENGVYAIGSGSSVWSLNSGGAQIRLLTCRIHDNGQHGVNCHGNDPWAWGWVQGSIDHCIVANNSLGGIIATGSGGVQPSIDNCVIYGNGGQGLGNSCSNFTSTVTNNIIALNLSGVQDSVGTSAPQYSFNDVWNNGTNWAGFPPSFDPVSNSNTSADPLFAAPAAFDFHLKSTEGRWQPNPLGGGTWVTDPVHSPCIDAGHFDSPFANEPAPNGGRCDQGVHGNTEESSKSRLSPVVLQCTDVADRAANFEIVVSGTGFAPDMTVSLWHPAGGMIAGTDVVVEGTTRIRCRVNLSAATVGFWDVMVREPFGAIGKLSDRLLVCNRRFYVNDASLVADVYATAAGNDASDGLTSSSPKATVQAVVDSYSLTAGDVVCIDTGSYTVATSIVVPSSDGGSSAMPLVFLASPMGVTITGTNAPSSSGWDIQASYVNVATATGPNYPAVAQRYMAITNFVDGIRINGYNCQLSRCEIAGNSSNGIIYHATNSPSLLVENCLVRGPGSVGIGQSAGNITVRNCTVTGYQYGIRAYGYFHTCTLQNNIIAVSGAGSYGLSDMYGNVPKSDHNDIWAINGASVGDRGATLGQWRDATGQDAHSLTIDPLFVNASGGDYHLQSTAGSYRNGAWIPDLANSCGIDTGWGDAGLETTPNATPVHAANEGQRNLGAYGGTEQASRTPSGRLLWLYAPIGSESFSDITIPVITRWTWVGRGWLPGDSVNLQVSANAGLNFGAISSAGIVGVAEGSYGWDVTGYGVGGSYRLKITSNREESVSDQSAGNFRLGFGMTYYVNDGSTDIDLWCSAAGNDVNDGLTPETPKASVQAVLGEYALKPGDVVRIDTGGYALSSDIVVSGANSGTIDHPITIVASPYGVTFDRAYSNSGGWGIYGAYVVVTTTSANRYPGVPQSWMRLRGSGWNVTIRGSNDRVSRCSIVQQSPNGAGIHIEGPNAVVENCLIEGPNGGNGVDVSNATGTSIRNCTLIGHFWYALYLYGSEIAVRNNIVWVDGSGYAFAAVVPTSDYNVIWLTSGAKWWVNDSGISSLSQWQAATGQDTHSVSADPWFVDAYGGDCHLQSTVGSYHGGAWTPDASNSCGIDTGDPAASFANEPGWNGGFCNLGAYGNTEQASRSADTDGDGLSNTYEAYRFGTNQYSPDTDGDEASDGSEFAAGTDAMNPRSVLRASIAPDGGGGSGLVVTWSSVPGKTYKVVYAASPAGPWQTGLPGSQVTASGGQTTLSYTDPTTAGVAKRFYRIQVVP